MISTTKHGILLAMCAVLGLDAATIESRSATGLAILDTVNNICLSDYAADHQLFAAMGNTPDTFTLSSGQLTLLGQTDNAVCDVAQASQLECNMPSDSGSVFSVDSNNILGYQLTNGGSSSVFYGCTNTNPPVGGPSTNYFVSVADYSPNCAATKLKLVLAALCPSVTGRAIKDLTTGTCLSSYSAAHAIYAKTGDPIDKFSLTDSVLTMDVGNGWVPKCVTSESGGYSKQFICSNDIDYDSDGQVIPSSFAYHAKNVDGNLILEYQNTDGSYSSSFYGCGWDSDVYFAVSANPESSPGVCHAAQLAFVDPSQCATLSTTSTADAATLDTVADQTTNSADSLGLNDADAFAQ